VTGKGVRWGRDRVGRSAPAFMAASTTASSPRLTARQADIICGSCGCCCKTGHRLVVSGGLCRTERQQAVFACSACSAGFLFACCHLCLPCPLPSSFAPFKFAFPRSVLILLCLPCPFHVRQDRREELFVSPPQATCLQAARLSRWQLQHGPAVAARAPVPFDSLPFSCRVHDPGPWVSVNNKDKLSV